MQMFVNETIVVKQQDDDDADMDAMTQLEYSDIIIEIEQQPYWRGVADKEMDYADGNQLDSDLLRKQS